MAFPWSLVAVIVAIVGAIVGVDERNVTVARDRGSVGTGPRSAIARLERSNGRRSRKRAAGLGFLIGAGGGAGVGFLSGSSRKCPGLLAPPGAPANQSCFLEPGASTLAGVILGGGAGVLLGSLVHPGDRWIVVPVDWLMGRVSSIACCDASLEKLVNYSATRPRSNHRMEPTRPLSRATVTLQRAAHSER